MTMRSTCNTRNVVLNATSLKQHPRIVRHPKSNIRYLSSGTEYEGDQSAHSEVDDDDEKHVNFGRGDKIRSDSITLQMRRERDMYIKRLNSMNILSSNFMTLASHLESLGFGQKRLLTGMYSKLSTYDEKKTNTGAGGFATHLGSAKGNWPIFKHLLPELAFAGHSNSGKVLTFFFAVAAFS